MSIVRLSRRVDRDRSLVQRWLNEREQVPRDALGEIVRELGVDDDLPYVMAIKDAEDHGDALIKTLTALAKATGAAADDLIAPALRLAHRRALDERPEDDRNFPSILARCIVDATYVFKQWNKFARTQDFTGVLGIETIGRHLHYPMNHFLGMAMRLGDDAGLIEVSNNATKHLRMLAEANPSDGPTELIRHHALHMLGRNGGPGDRALVSEVMTDAKRSDDPVARRLGYMGLIVGSGDRDLLDQYAGMLAVDTRLKLADLHFDAMHYGDIELDGNQRLPTQVGVFDKTITHILRHLENPDANSELDSLRLFAILDAVGSAPFERPEVSLRLYRIFQTWSPPAPHSHRQRLENRLFRIIQRSPQNRIETDMLIVKTDPQYDVFLAYNSHDVDEVRTIATLLKREGVTTWVDFNDLPPGKLFQRELDKILKTCRCAVVLIGPNGIGPWEDLEVMSAISEFVHRGAPVIPVMLSGGVPDSTLPAFLRQFRMVRYGKTAADLQDLIWGITGSKPLSTSI